tara:strand:+ start:412 stop:780 length:369 start_codon:yes stop_codon:yes gene_type:complete
MATKIDKKYNPDKDYPYFLYNPKGNGFEYFRTKELRDNCASDEVQAYLDDAWDEQVTNIVVGEVTGQASMVDLEVKPTTTDEEGVDGEGSYWPDGCDCRCDYKVMPVGFVCPSTNQLTQKWR